ncbi:serine/threonine protein kinase [Streptomyces sp. NPDC017082]|uniref:serine/threonine protein kinase n=1 Tax=Streptomyces sp. NPDC017082 TaxID=3364974 RepID=UPI00379E999B
MHDREGATGVAAGGGAGGTGPARRRVGPYTLITALDEARTRLPVPERRYIARGADSTDTVLLSLPLPGADPRRFLAEAEDSRYLLGPCAAPATAVAGPDGPAWHARPYLPVLPLPTALAVHGGPLPERTVRALGAALAETLAIVHGQGLAFAGVSPAAVLLAADGPRLTCFGAVRAAAPDGTPRSGLPGLEAGSLPPEQASGGRPRPLGDVYALGATLAYAATGHTAPERDELPAALRTVIGRCLARDPGSRPQLAELIAELTDASDSPLAPGRLPGRVIAALAHQSAALLTAETAVGAAPVRN